MNGSDDHVTALPRPVMLQPTRSALSTCCGKNIVGSFRTVPLNRLVYYSLENHVPPWEVLRLGKPEAHFNRGRMPNRRPAFP